MMRVRVVGAGALGMLLAASLSVRGTNVELVARSGEQAARLESEGLLLTDRDDAGEPLSVTARPRIFAADELASGGAAKHGPPDVVLLTVKQTAVTDDLARELADQLKPDSRLVCFQNGIGHTDVLSRHISAGQILIAVTTEGALRHSQRHVEHTGRGSTWLGSLEEGEATGSAAMQKKLQNLFQDAGFAVSLSNQINSKVWNKLMINAVINPLTAILQIPNGMLLKLPAAMPLMRGLYEEGAGLAKQLGIGLADDLWDQLLDVCRLTAANSSSMLQDIRARRRTELDAITGGLLAQARRIGMELPTHAAVYQLVRAIEQQWAIL
ncbi:2-dehydropantoate 2-reductase [Paenibacillus doosanensis]|uniref:2-dehydropantoate 2-reductase n=1 Tax=Paenibacillus konkukensis TaxID=2020716 RepID=A0ABY4RXF2_9BACL|nr:MULTISPECIES: 2-dehydropantoate 2-reductase [Paenibacillus]MCS7463428.1 2-dehydropantoate 2-reductase [Paenibacillus doosanensis]UQZ87036.1 2-dehydropantoate 2-reductase [Paenibacillus konkukensis]